MTSPPSRTPYGLARVAFRAHLSTIRAEIDAGWPAKSIYERHKAKLGGMSYRSFARYVRDEIGKDQPPVPTENRGKQSYAGHDPAKPRTFTFDGNPSEADAALIRPAGSKPKD